MRTLTTQLSPKTSTDHCEARMAQNMGDQMIKLPQEVCGLLRNACC